MRRGLKSILLSVVSVAVGIAAGFQLRVQGQAGTAQQAPAAVAAAAPADTAALRTQYEQWRKDFKTWGKWGTDDNKGASNLITPQKVLSAVRLVRRASSSRSRRLYPKWRPPMSM
jgi:hypothetical protein